MILDARCGKEDKLGSRGLEIVDREGETVRDEGAMMRDGRCGKEERMGQDEAKNGEEEFIGKEVNAATKAVNDKNHKGKAGDGGAKECEEENAGEGKTSSEDRERRDQDQ